MRGLSCSRRQDYFYDLRNLTYVTDNIGYSEHRFKGENYDPNDPSNAAPPPHSGDAAVSNQAAEAASPAVEAAVAAYLQGRGINTVIWYEEYDFILRNPDWWVLYEIRPGRTADPAVLRALKAILEQQGELVTPLRRPSMAPGWSGIRAITPGRSVCIGLTRQPAAKYHRLDEKSSQDHQDDAGIDASDVHERAALEQIPAQATKAADGGKDHFGTDQGAPAAGPADAQSGSQLRADRGQQDMVQDLAPAGPQVAGDIEQFRGDRAETRDETEVGRPDDGMQDDDADRWQTQAGNREHDGQDGYARQWMQNCVQEGDHRTDPGQEIIRRGQEQADQTADQKTGNDQADRLHPLQEQRAPTVRSQAPLDRRHRRHDQ